MKNGNGVQNELMRFRIDTRITLKQIAEETKLSYPTVLAAERGRGLGRLTEAVLLEYMAKKREELKNEEGR